MGGAGEMAELTATHLRSQAVRSIAVTSRTQTRAEALAQKVDGRAVTWSELPAQLLTADIMVTAPGAQTPVINRTQVDEAMRARRNRPLFIIDIGLPRDVDPAASALEQVFLYNIDDLRTLVDENLARRRDQMSQAESMVSDEVESFQTWLRARGSIPTLVALRRHFEDLRLSELNRLEPKLNGLSPEARSRVDEITRLLVQKLLISPTERLKNAGDEQTAAQYSEVVTQLFGLAEPLAGETTSTDEHASPPPKTKTPVTS